MFRYAFLTLAMLGTVTGLLSVTCPEWATESGLDVWNLPEIQRQIIAQQQFTADLDRQDQVIIKRIAAKEQIINDLLAERLTLLEAAAWFRRINAEPPEYSTTLPPYNSGKTEGERYCRQVLQWARITTYDWTPSHAEEVGCRLTAEFENYLTSADGTLELPEI